MASGTLVEGGVDRGREKNRWIGNKVYTRKVFRKGIKNGSQQTQPPPASVVSEEVNPPSNPPSTRLDLASDVDKGETLVENGEAVVDRDEVPVRTCPVQTTESHVSINLAAMSKQEIREVKQKLVDELVQVHDLLKRLEAKELQLKDCVEGYVDEDVDVVGCTDTGIDPPDGMGVGVDSYSRSHSSANDVVDDGGGGRMVSEVNMGNGGASRMVIDVDSDVGDERRMIPEIAVDNGGVGRMVSNSGGDSGGGGRRMISEFNLDSGDESGGGRRMAPEFNLDSGGESGGGGRMISQYNLDSAGNSGGGRRTVSEFNSGGESDGGRKMFSEGNLDNGFPRRSIPHVNLGNGNGRRMISEFNLDNGGPRRMIPEINSMGKREPPRSLHQLRVSVMENGRSEMTDYVEKRTPKANQYYRNSDFIVGKERFPPNKKSKINGSKKHGRVGEKDYGFGLIKHASQVFKNCSSLLTRLMKHKHGWVFNAPVDVKGLGLHDYFLIIKHPMDLGTVKTRLNTNFYRSPREFAEEIRLTFRNAMTYNPKGQDVHIMAEQLSRIFEDRWAVMETEYDLDSWFELYHEASVPTSTMTRAPLMPPLEMGRSLDSMQSTPLPVQPRHFNRSLSGRGTALKKPKAKDLNKRDMTYEEKQKLSKHLESLPSEKLDSIVEIIRRRNTNVLQHDDAIEVDIDSVDAETLWELDRFVTNYKKSLSKYKRKAEIAMQAREEAKRNVQNQVPVVAGMTKENKIDERSTVLPPPHEEDKKQDSSSRSSSSSSSSSDSGSSSSDSDSDSSSESDAGQSPRS